MNLISFLFDTQQIRSRLYIDCEHSYRYMNIFLDYEHSYGFVSIIKMDFSVIQDSDHEHSYRFVTTILDCEHLIQIVRISCL